MSTELPTLPHQLIDSIERHLAASRAVEDAAPNHLAAVFPQLEAMIDSGDLASAVALLNTALTGWDPESAPPHVFLISAARTYVRLLPVSDITTAQQWARYAGRAAQCLSGR
jgi:hypothetical protein